MSAPSDRLREVARLVQRTANLHAEYVGNPAYRFTCVHDMRRQGVSKTELLAAVDAGLVERTQGDGVLTWADMYTADA